MFERDRLGLFSSTEYTSDGGWRQSASQYGNFGTTGYAVDVFYLRHNGYRQNDDFEEVDLWGKIKQQLTPDDAVLVQAIYLDRSSGDTRQLYDPDAAYAAWRTLERQEPILLAGYHRRWSPAQQTLFLAGWLNDTLQVSDSSTNNRVPVFSVYPEEGRLVLDTKATPRYLTRDWTYRSELNLGTVEAQHIWAAGRFTTLGGVRYQGGDVFTESGEANVQVTPLPVDDVPAVLPGRSVQADFERFAAYAIRVLGGAAGTPDAGGRRVVRPHSLPRESPLPAALTRRDHARPGLAQSRPDCHPLAPHDAAGQLYAVVGRVEPGPELPAGADPSGRVCAGLSQCDSRIGGGFIGGSPARNRRGYAGPSFPHAHVRRGGGPVSHCRATQERGTYYLVWLDGTEPASYRNEVSYQETSFTASADQLLGDGLSLGMRYRLSHTSLDQQFDNPLVTSTEQEATLHALDARLLLNLPCGFFSEFQSLWRSQSNRGDDAGLPGDSFVQFNVYAGYRWLRRRVEVRLGILNLSDEDYNLNPLSYYAELPRERTFYASLKLEF